MGDSGLVLVFQGDYCDSICDHPMRSPYALTLCDHPMHSPYAHHRPDFNANHRGPSISQYLGKVHQKENHHVRSTFEFFKLCILCIEKASEPKQAEAPERVQNVSLRSILEPGASGKRTCSIDGNTCATKHVLRDWRLRTWSSEADNRIVQAWLH